MNERRVIFNLLIAVIALSCNAQKIMPTGFYYLVEDSKGVKMPLRGSGAVYVLAPSAFASVKDVARTQLTKTSMESGIYTELCMIFDPKGTQDLRNGTGNPQHPKIAVVVANQLLYVVDNNSKIKTGVMCVGLVDFSESEMLSLKAEVDNKR